MCVGWVSDRRIVGSPVSQPLGGRFSPGVAHAAPDRDSQLVPACQMGVRRRSEGCGMPVARAASQPFGLRHAVAPRVGGTVWGLLVGVGLEPTQ